MKLIELVRLLEMKTGKSVKKSGSGYVGCCPAHDDSSPSLSLCEGNEEKLLVKCFTGCSPDNICSSLGISIANLFPEKITGHSPRKRIEYPYHDEEGRVLFTKIRIEPGFEGRDKSFYWERALASAWRLSRVARIEAMVMDRAIDFLDRENLSRIFGGCSGEKLMLMSRYEVMLERSLFKALEELKSLQFSRQRKETLIEGEIGFVPQKLGDIITL